MEKGFNRALSDLSRRKRRRKSVNREIIFLKSFVLAMNIP
jgi:hypothetical protein